jgi:hypothetical protein
MNPDNLAAACGILAREWGAYGYRIVALEETGQGARRDLGPAHGR